MKRAVTDPGVLIAAVLSAEGSPALLITEWLSGGFELIVCPHLLNELAETLRRKKFRAYLTIEEAENYVEMLERLAIVVTDPTEILPVTADPNDDYLVALARETNCDVLVSGDKHLTQDPDLVGLVQTPRQFADSLPSIDRQEGPIG